MQQKIFIGGAPRTGTTLLKGILCNDSETFPVIRECTYLRYLISAYSQGKFLWDYHTYDYFDNKEDFQNFHKEIINKYFNHVYSRFGQDKVMIQKHPGLAIHFPDLDELYPNECLFILMIRDPRDAIASFLKINKDKGYTVKNSLDAYMESYYNSMNYFLGKWDADNILFIKYEDLLLNTNTVMNQLRNFTNLELNFDPLKEEWESKRGSSEWSSELDGKPIESTNIGNYVFELSQDEINFIESHKEKINSLFNDNVFCDNINVSSRLVQMNKEDLKEKLKSLYNNGRTSEILEIIEDIIENYPEEYLFNKIAGLIFEEVGEISKAFYYTQKGIELSPDDFHLYNCLGLLYHRINDFDKALENFNKVIEINPNFPDVYNNISLVYKDMKEYNKSKNYSQTAISLDPSFNEAEFNMEDSILNSIDINYNEKIFCIGMNRTGTTSIGKALDILGYNVKTEIRKQDERMISEQSYDKIVPYVLEVSENYDAFTHEPWNIFYKELDKKFSNAKFILTLRDEQSWLKSFYNYFKNKDNSWAPFLLKVYGIEDIDSIDSDEFFLEKFRLHNQSVINYFKGRNDLLVMNVFQDDGWNKLCNFLNINIPAKKFPHSNKGDSNK